MKKTLSLLLSLWFVFIFTFGASAIPLSAGGEALNAQFSDGTDGTLDYVYFSPVKGENDTVKYPLVVWLHGMNSGLEPRAQLKWYNFSNWASDEYQSRFVDAGGAFLLAVRASGRSGNDWTEDMCPTVKAAIDSFIAENSENIDKDRISIAGYSTGGAMVWDMISAYNGFFAAALPIAAFYQPTADDINRVLNVAIWMFTCDVDPYAFAATADAIPNFNSLKVLSKRKADLRMTSFSEAVLADGSKHVYNGGVIDDTEHYIWEAVTYDMHMADGITPYKYAVTVDGNGNTVELTAPETGVISWLSAQRRLNSVSDPVDGSDVVIPTLTDSVRAFFIRLFGYIKAFFEGIFDRLK